MQIPFTTQYDMSINLTMTLRVQNVKWSDVKLFTSTSWFAQYLGASGRHHELSNWLSKLLGDNFFPIMNPP